METGPVGIRGFLSNPMNVRKINRAIRRALSHKRKGGIVLTRILVVDGDLQSRETIVKSLSRAGYDVRGAADEKDAMAVYCEHPADLMIADLHMPDGESLETVASFHRHFPELRILAISSTAGPLNSNLRVCAALGAASTLVRPFDNDELLDIVRDLAGI